MNSYISELVDTLNERLEEGEVCIRLVHKNNCTEKTGIEYHKEGSKVSPILYLDGLFEEYQKTGDFHFDYIIEMLTKNTIDFDSENYCNWDYVKSNVVCRLVNIDLNSDILPKTPNVKLVGDLGFIFCYYLDNSQNAFVTITNDHLKMWNKTVDDLYFVAMLNTERLFPPTFTPLNDILKKLGVEVAPEEPIPMYVASNDKSLYGASVVFYTSYLEKLSKSLNSKEMYLIPSSVHEWIIFMDLSSSVEEIVSIIKEVNTTQLSPDEILSDKLYYYNADTNIVSEISSRR